MEFFRSVFNVFRILVKSNWASVLICVSNSIQIDCISRSNLQQRIKVQIYGYAYTSVYSQVNSCFFFSSSIEAVSVLIKNRFITLFDYFIVLGLFHFYFNPIDRLISRRVFSSLHFFCFVYSGSMSIFTYPIISVRWSSRQFFVRILLTVENLAFTSHSIVRSFAIFSMFLFSPLVGLLERLTIL